MREDKKKLITLMNDCSETGLLPCEGMCATISGLSPTLKDKFDLFLPTNEDLYELELKDLSTVYWASLLPSHLSNSVKGLTYTRMRETILCFMLVIELEEFNDN